jgi:hypothetical protein
MNNLLSLGILQKSLVRLKQSFTKYQKNKENSNKLFSILLEIKKLKEKKSLISLWL